MQYLQNVSNYEVDKTEYFLRASELLSLKYLTFTYGEKEIISKSLLENLQLNTHQEQGSSLSKAIITVFENALEGIFNTKKCKILENILFSVVFLQILSQSELKDKIDQLFALECQILQKLEIVVELITSIEWIHHKNFSKYDYGQIKFKCMLKLQDLMSRSCFSSQLQKICQWYLKDMVKYNRNSTLQIWQLTVQYYGRIKKRDRHSFKKYYEYFNYLEISPYVLQVATLQQIERAQILELYKYYYQIDAELYPKSYKTFHIRKLGFLQTIKKTKYQTQAKKLLQQFVYFFSQTAEFYKYQITANQLIYQKQEWFQGKNFDKVAQHLYQAITSKSKQYFTQKYPILASIVLFNIIRQHTPLINAQYPNCSQEFILKHNWQQFVSSKIVFDKPYYYQLKNHCHSTLGTQINQMQTMKLTYFITILKLSPKQSLQRLKAEFQFYMNQLELVKCIQCKYFALLSLQNFKFRYTQKGMWQFTFEVILQRCIYMTKTSLDVYTQIYQLLAIYDDCQTLRKKYSFAQIYNYLAVIPTTGTFYPNQLKIKSNIISYYLFVEQASLLKKYLTSLFQIVNRIRQCQYIMNLNQIKLGMLSFLTQREKMPQIGFFRTKNQINSRWQQIYQIYKAIDYPQAVLLYNSLLYLSHDQNIIKAKKKIFREMALRFSSVSLIIKQLCFSDYLNNFIAYFKIQNCRRKHFLLRKYLAYNFFLLQLSKRLKSTIQPNITSQLVSKKVINKIKRSNPRIGKIIQTKKEKLDL